MSTQHHKLCLKPFQGDHLHPDAQRQEASLTGLGWLHKQASSITQHRNTQLEELEPATCTVGQEGGCFCD